MQTRRIGHAIDEFIHAGVTHVLDKDIEGDDLAGERMVTVDRELAILDPSHTEDLRCSLIVLEFHFGADVLKLGRHVGDVVGKSQFRLVLAESLFGADADIDLVTMAVAFQRPLDFFDQLAVSTVDVIDRQVDAFKRISGFIGESVSQ